MGTGLCVTAARVCAVDVQPRWGRTVGGGRLSEQRLAEEKAPGGAWERSLPSAAAPVGLATLPAAAAARTPEPGTGHLTSGFCVRCVCASRRG